MREVIMLLADVVNEIHDVLVQTLGVNLSDKELHFWIIGLIGMVFFLFVYLLFKWIERWKFSTTILSFIYTFTMMVVVVFAIEIQQAVTNRGNMEFADAAIGLWGFVVFFAVYAIGVGIIYGTVQRVKRRRHKKQAKKETPVHSEPAEKKLAEKPQSDDIAEEPKKYRSQIRKEKNNK